MIVLIKKKKRSYDSNIKLRKKKKILSEDEISDFDVNEEQLELEDTNNNAFRQCIFDRCKYDGMKIKLHSQKKLLTVFKNREEEEIVPKLRLSPVIFKNGEQKRSKSFTPFRNHKSCLWNKERCASIQVL